MPVTTFSISGNVGIAGATIALSGTSTGSTTSASDGTYSFSGLGAGSYTVTPSLTGFTFTPASKNETLGPSVAGINFNIPYSVPDCRSYGSFPNTSRHLNGTLVYGVQTSSNSTIPGTDSRTAGAPVDSRTNIPVNSRTPGTYGPGE